MKQLLGLLFFAAACFAAWGFWFAFAALASHYIGFIPAFWITVGCVAAILAFFWYETKTTR